MLCSATATASRVDLNSRARVKFVPLVLQICACDMQICALSIQGAQICMSRAQICRTSVTNLTRARLFRSTREAVAVAEQSIRCCAVLPCRFEMQARHSNDCSALRRQRLHASHQPHTCLESTGQHCFALRRQQLHASPQPRTSTTRIDNSLMPIILAHKVRSTHCNNTVCKIGKVERKNEYGIRQRHKLELARDTNADSHQKSTRTKKKKSHEGRSMSRKCGHRYIPAETCITHFIKQCERNIKKNTHREAKTNIPRALCISSQVYQSELVRANI